MKEFTFIDDYRHDFKYELYTHNNAILVINRLDLKTGEVKRGAYKIVSDDGHIWKVQKTQIKAKDGATGIINFIEKNITEDFAYHIMVGFINNVLNLVKPVKAVI